MVEDIRLIKNWDVAHFQDKLLMIFWRYVKDQVTELLVEQPGGALPAKLVTASVELLAAITAMFDAFQLVDTKSMSAELKRKDEERDNQLRGVKQMVAAMLRLAQTDEEQAAAKALQQSIDDWGLDPRQAYVLESTVVVEWLMVVAESEELTRAADPCGRDVWADGADAAAGRAVGGGGINHPRPQRRVRPQAVVAAAAAAEGIGGTLEDLRDRAERGGGDGPRRAALRTLRAPGEL